MDHNHNRKKSCKKNYDSDKYSSDDSSKNFKKCLYN